MDHFEGAENEDHYDISFYDMNWNRLNVRYGEHESDDIPKPPHLEEMLRIAKVLSKGFPFVRVDFFDTDDQLYIAELTFYPGGGLTPYNPLDFDKTLGDLFVLPEQNLQSQVCLTAEMFLQRMRQYKRGCNL